jgi:hypothetical protein
MIPERTKPKKSHFNIVISLVFHSVLVTSVFYFAAREGMLGQKMKQLTVTMEKKQVAEKKPEPAKQPEQKPVEKPVETAKAVAVPAPVAQPAAAAPVADSAPVAAPASIGADFSFADGAKATVVGDAVSIYRQRVENALRQRWDRPEDMEDDAFVAEVDVRIEPNGALGGYSWVKGSGNTRWDNSVRQALAQTKTVNQNPPKGFPASFRVRFDVESMRVEEALQVSVR